MPRIARGLLIPVMAGIIYSAASAVESHQIIMKFRAGQARRFSLEQHLSLTIQPDALPATEINSEIKAVLRQQVIKVEADGSAELECQMETWLRRNWLGQAAVQADPEERQHYLKTKLRLRIAPHGAVEVLQPGGLPPALDLDAYADYSYLPGRPMPVGSEWPGERTLFSQGVESRLRTKTRLESVENARARIAQDVILEMPQFKPGGVGQITARGVFFGAGEIVFDLGMGLPREVSYYFRGTFLVQPEAAGAKEVPMQAEMTSVMKLMP